LQHIVNNTPNAFTDYKGVTKSYNPARNVPERAERKLLNSQARGGKVWLFPQM
jgi:hypothetical protein